MKTIKFSIQFYGYWHIGSGLSGGTKADSLVLKDHNKLPYIPGKTIKGLFRHAAEELAALSESYLDQDMVQKAFGTFGYSEDSGSKLFFSDAQLSSIHAKEILSLGLSESLYEVISSTKIDELGVAEDKSLRQMEVTIPLTLYGAITDFESKYYELLSKSATMIKYLGLNRNRGLGRCEIKVFES
ncbi:RAMP superfamily CRISPR-associated protein [Belliella kenyensis]|uniref:RAMP superfamily CRISPR-associated protein n=1 Tax=Belliella kenyensis TaxID=1472724 RepID=A0ABV8ETE9_9BACT|nr:RAMP superfamily CRISPR-associated protein [Belliella kenyensis]MCH7402138.1 RAMP superfamily CRISPR-associated protein [Belliella kenyensis]MDN3601653.1 RAMP superfamily CRISPR-associated protein [Belliella kenyensis]